MVNGQVVRFLVDKSFKFLGRVIFASLREGVQATSLVQLMRSQMEDIDRQLMSAASKAWLYQHYVISFSSWPFMVYDFPLSVPSEMTDIATRFLKSWYGLARPAEVSILYRGRAKHGLQLTSFLAHYKAMRVCRVHLVKHSPDPVMRQLYNLKLKRAWQSKKPWSAPIALEEAEAEVDLEEKFPGQSTKHGLGFIRPSYRIRLSTAAPSADHRTRVLAKVRHIAEEQSLVRVYGLALAGNWLKLDGVMQQALSWTA